MAQAACGAQPAQRRLPHARSSTGARLCEMQALRTCSTSRRYYRTEHPTAGTAAACLERLGRGVLPAKVEVDASLLANHSLGPRIILQQVLQVTAQQRRDSGEGRGGAGGGSGDGGGCSK